MAKLLILLATVFAALLLVDASIYRATVVIEDEANPRGQDCRSQFEQQKRLRNCQRFIKSKSGQSQRDMNPQREEEQEFQQCCNRLRNMDSQCVCESLEYAVRELQQGGGQEGQSMQDFMRVAQQIPSACQMPQGECQFGQSQRFLY